MLRMGHQDPETTNVEGAGDGVESPVDDTPVEPEPEPEPEEVTARLKR